MRSTASKDFFLKRMKSKFSFVLMSDVRRGKIGTSKRLHYGNATDAPSIDAALVSKFLK